MTPIISQKNDIATNDRKEAKVVGLYIQIDVRMRQKTPPLFDGHVAILLEDDTQVLLYPVWDKQARRDSQEITQFEGRRVEVSGKLYARAPENSEGSSNLRLPCLKDITAIHLASKDI
jgi:hypothetical protein